MAKTSKRNTRGFGSEVMDLAQERPIAAAAAAAAAVGAGVFLWSRRNQISGQLSDLSDQISEWTENLRSGGSSGDWNQDDDTAGAATLVESGGGRSESASGRRRVRRAPTT